MTDIVSISTASTRYWLTASFEPTGELVLFGHDLSPDLEEMVGRDEYEYFYRVAAIEVPRVATALETTPERLLEAIRDHLQPHGIDASRVWKEWLKTHSIPYEFSVR